MKKVVLILLCFSSSFLFLFGQTIKERRVYYLDQSYSMVKNNIYCKVCDSLIAAVENVKYDNSVEVMVIPFAFSKDTNAALKPLCDGAMSTPEGKQSLIAKIKSLNWKNRGTMTYHKDPIEDFYNNNRAIKNGVTYMFIMTDGEDEWPDKNRFKKDLKEWNNKYYEDDIYGFYVMLHESACDSEIKKIVSAEPYFWNVYSPNVNINIVRPNYSTIFNCRSENGISDVDVVFVGNINGLSFTAQGNDTLKVISCKTMNDSVVRVSIKRVFDNCDLLDSAFYNYIQFTLKDADDENVLITNNGQMFNVLVEDRLRIKCKCKPGSDIRLKKKTISNWSYSQSIFQWFDDKINYRSLGIVKHLESGFSSGVDSTIVAVNEFVFNCNESAEKRRSFVKLQFIVDDRLKDCDYAIYANDKKLEESFLIDKDKKIKFSFWISPDVPEGKYNISLKVVDCDLMYFDGNEISENKIVKSWVVYNDRIINPFWIWLLRALLLLLLLLLLLYIWYLIRKFKAPKFPRPRVRLRFRIEPDDSEPANVQLNNKNMNNRNTIDTSALHNRYIKSIYISESSEKDKKPLRRFNRFKDWISKKWNGEIIYVQGRFQGRPISYIEIIPIKTNKEIRVNVKMKDRENIAGGTIMLEWRDKYEIKTYNESENENNKNKNRVYLYVDAVSNSKSNCYIEAYNGEPKSVEKGYDRKKIILERFVDRYMQKNYNTNNNSTNK